MPSKPSTQNPLTARKPDLPLSLTAVQTIYCGDCLEQLPHLPPESVDLIYIDPPFNSNRNYEVFWGESREKREFGIVTNRLSPT
jgi:DNA modification methylase